MMCMPWTQMNPKKVIHGSSWIFVNSFNLIKIVCAFCSALQWKKPSFIAFLTSKKLPSARIEPATVDFEPILSERRHCRWAWRPSLGRKRISPKAVNTEGIVPLGTDLDAAVKFMDAAVKFMMSPYLLLHGLLPIVLLTNSIDTCYFCYYNMKVFEHSICLLNTERLNLDDSL